jgi:hypothetical protein
MFDELENHPITTTASPDDNVYGTAMREAIARVTGRTFSNNLYDGFGSWWRPVGARLGVDRGRLVSGHLTGPVESQGNSPK